MSEVINPPDYYFSGINFNPAFYAQDSGAGLSQAQANTLYLRKTVPDTATADETFTADIICGGAVSVKDSLSSPTSIITIDNAVNTPTIDLASATLGTLTVGSNSVQVATTKQLNIGTNTNVDLNVGIGTRNGAGTGPSPYIIHNYSDGDNCTAGNGVHLNNGLSNGSNTNIANGSLTSGTVNILTGSLSTGSVNIGQYATSPSVTKTTTTIAGDVTIGSTGATTTINGTIVASGLPTLTANNTFTGQNTFNNATAGVKADSIQGVATTGAQSFFTTKTAGDLSVFASAGSTAVLNVKGSGIKFDTSSTDNPTGIQSLFSNKTGGTLNLGSNQTAGAISIGGVGSTTTVYGGLTSNFPLTFGWTTAPTLTTQLGYSFTSTQVSTTSISTSTFLGTISIAQAGCYMVTVNAQVQNNTAGVVTSAFLSIGGTSIGLGIVYGSVFQNATVCYPVVSNGGYSFNVNMSVATASVANINTAYLVYSYMRVG